MKLKLFFSGVLLLILANAGQCQILKIDDLMQTIKCKDKDCYNAYVTAQGFVYDKQMGIVDSEQHFLYVVDNSLAAASVKLMKGPGKDRCYFAIAKNGKVKSAIDIHDQKQYLACLEELNLLGFRSSGFRLALDPQKKQDILESSFKSQKYPKLKVLLTTYPKLSKDSPKFYRFLMVEI